MKGPKKICFLHKSIQWVKKLPLRKRMLAGATAAVVAMAAIGIPSAMKNEKVKKSSAAETRVVSAKVTEGSISTTVTGTGTLAYGDAIEVRIPDDITIDEVLVKSGDTVTEGQALATIEKQSLSESISDIQDSISDIDADIEALDDTETEKTVTTAVGGRVKTVNISAGYDVTEVLTRDMSLITISTDGSMAVDISDTSCTKGTDVTVTLADGSVIDGVISQVTGTKSVITIPDQYGTNGETVYVHLLDGTSLGIGTLYISQPYQITASGGTVSSIYVTEGETVDAGDSLFYLTDIYDQTELNRLLTLRTAYVSMLEERVDLLSNLTITSPRNGIIAEVYAEADEEVSSDKSSSESKSNSSSASSASQANSSSASFASQVSSSRSSSVIQYSGIENNDGMSYPVLAFRNTRSLPTVQIASPEKNSVIEEEAVSQTAAASVSESSGSGETENQNSETPAETSEEGSDTSETDKGDSEQNSSEENSSEDNSATDSSSTENSSGENTSESDQSRESSAASENSHDTTAVSGTVKIPLLSPLNGVEMKVSALNSAIEDLFDDEPPYLVESMDWEGSEVCLVFKSSPGYYFDGSANNTIEIIDDASETDYSWSYKLTLEDDGRTAYDTMTVKIAFSEEEDEDSSGSGAENSSDAGSGSESSASDSKTSSNSNSSDSKSSSNSTSDSRTGSTSSSSNSKSSSGTASSGSKSSSGSSSSGSKTGSGSSSSGSKSSSGSSSSSGSASSSSGSSQDLYEQSRTTAFTLQNSDEMQVTITVDELDILSISEGQEVSISLDAIEGQTFTGKVSAIGSGSSSGGVSKYSVDILIPREESMLSGMTASAIVTVDSAEGVLTVPAAAIQESRGESYVYTELDEEGAPTGQVNVETGLSDGSRVQITGALSADQIVYYTEASGTDIKEDEEESSGNERRNQMGTHGTFEGSDRSGDRPSGGGNRPSGGGNRSSGGSSNRPGGSN